MIAAAATPRATMAVVQLSVLVEVRLRPGIADPQGATIERSLPTLGFGTVRDVTVGKAIRCTVENHGKEALEKGGKDRGNHSQQYTINSEEEHNRFRHWEPTSYRGLHYMIIDVSYHGGRYSTRFGVWID